MTKNNGGPAFPVEAHPHAEPGMSLRDYFAAKIYPVLIAAAAAGHIRTLNGNQLCPEEYARCAYEGADAMLAERVK